ncbi:hypothetical protein DSO57_1006542 [Entomophthora muscae]|uniref:Uncharacterized protein n=1 Tax=Entomophthora muscae TaxID=34485 RepID=A0ACC2S9T8_9FUNG|nr:hypothetical protein DSO57_1006542 [Entomophthora muscae]
MAAILSPLPKLNNIPFLTCLVGNNLEHLWDSIRRENPKLVWITDKEAESLRWHLMRSDGSFKFGTSVVLWYGLSREEAASIITQFDDSHLGPTKSVQSNVAQRTGVRSYSTAASPQLRVGLIGARGHTGQELVQLINSHPNMRLTHISSRELSGKILESYTKEQIRYELIPADVIGQIDDVDAWILALPNGVAKTYVDALDKKPGPVILDLSADYRFDDSGRWWYGLPELYPFSGKASAGNPAVTRISNPGCYATGCQVGLKPLIDATVGKGLQLPGRPTIFGVSGFSGAGTTSSPKNDPEVLRDNMIPYSLTGHIHEREAGRHLKTPVYFSPHVASFFRGITLTISVPLPAGVDFTSQSLLDLYSSTYSQHGLIDVQEEVPLVKDNQNHHGVRVGGFTMAKDGSRAVLVATLDNLLKGAATQAIQNLNLAFGLPGHTGIPPFK